MVKQTKEARWAVGGNAPVMANRLALEGASVLIGAHSTPYIKFSDHVKGIRYTHSCVQPADWRCCSDLC